MEIFLIFIPSADYVVLPSFFLSRQTRQSILNSSYLVFKDKNVARMMESGETFFS
jgi:hypothetical protein